MKILLIMPSRASKEPVMLEALDYLRRLRPPLSAQTLFINPKKAISEDRAPERIIKESEELWQKSLGYYRIALAPEGRIYSSEAWALHLNKLAQTKAKIAFIIGGAFGLDKKIISQCDETLSLSAMTLPHRLAFLCLSEQLYRASEIISGTAYHK